VAFGDSLTAGYGVPRGQSYPDFLQQELLDRGLRYRVVNEGVSGDTTAMALQRIDLALAEHPEVVVLALGGNDGLRGLPADSMEANLREMVARFQEAGAVVVLAGMTLPPNFGAAYIRQFESVFPRVAKDTGAKLIPFLLDGVAADRELNQEDGIHPTAEGNRIVAKTVADYLVPLLEGEPHS
jgi:acyl-CoA thioesterase-1